MGVTSSFQKYLEDKMGLETVIHHDGIVLPEKPPYIVVRQSTNTSRYVAKARETVATVFRFRIMVNGSTLAERSILQDRMRNLFDFGEIPLMDEEGKDTGKVFEVRIESEVPLNATEINQRSTYHEVYFEVSTMSTRHKNIKGEI